MSELAVSVRGVTKCYRVFDRPAARLRHLLSPSYREGLQEIWALHGVDLEVRRGESVAIIGRNGGGKSTLLQILTGTLAPTSGEVRIDGRVSALLELGSGFNPEYTGRDNVVLNGLLLGLTREQIRARFDEILAFAEIGEAIDRPVKTYSSGMVMRLAFAVQALTDPDILIIDEALSVGDFFFQQKCFEHIRGLRARGVTLLFVSHDMGTVRDLCSRAVYLKAGRVQYAGETRIAIREYLAERQGDARPLAAPAAIAEAVPRGELDELLRDALWRTPHAAAAGHLLAVAFYDEQGQPATAFRLGSRMRIRAAYRPSGDTPTHVAVAVWNKYNQVVTAVGSTALGLPAPSGSEGDVLLFDLSLQLLLEAGNYSFMVSLSHVTAPNQGANLDATPQLGPVSIRWDYSQDHAPFLGMVGLPAAGSFRAVAAHERGAA